MILSTITHDVRTNTLEVTWVKEELDEKGNVVAYVNEKCRSYSSEQVADFLADVQGGDKYLTLTGWVV